MKVGLRTETEEVWSIGKFRGPELPLFIYLLGLLLLSLACRAGVSQGTAGLDPGDHRRTLEAQGLSRSYLIHVPPQAADGKPMPVVLNFHGGGGNAQGYQDYVLMDELADEKGFLVVYPNGTGPFEGRLLTWNAGTCCGYAEENQVDDVAFIRDLVEDLGTVVPLDADRIYATGLSNGAMMSYRLAAEAPDLVRGIAPVAGAMVLEASALTEPVAVIHFHSVDDPRALYQGGLGPPFPFTNSRVMHNPVDEVIADWAAHNGCSPEPVQGATLTGEPDSRNEGQTAIRFAYEGCLEGSPVVFWKLTVAGHVWPGGMPDYLSRILGPSTDLIDANREMWAFFTELP